MRPLVAKIKPAGGFSQVVHISLNVLLPIMLFILVRINFVQLALVLILLSKWRMLAVRPRFWWANVRANAVDLVVGVSILVFMANTPSQLLQVLWVVLYGVWLTVIKPASNTPMVALQASLGYLAGLLALSVGWETAPLYGLVLMAGIICYISAHHFFDAFDESHTRMLAYVWGYFGAALMWVLGHWLLFYGAVSQPSLLLLSLGYGFATLYYLDHFDRLSVGVRRQVLFIMLAIVIIVIAFSDWGNKIV
ncbi:MAG TPA: hypothetical protein VLG16_05890 [Candidatus Saccharimonadales bacterium]|nr:hypothetical protein [Candidatus Saccharimonadales bacterium]